jgi:hypothetical protein
MTVTVVFKQESVKGTKVCFMPFKQTELEPIQQCNNDTATAEPKVEPNNSNTETTQAIM